MSTPSASVVTRPHLLFRAGFRHDEIVRELGSHVVELPVAPSRFFASDNFSGTHPRYLAAIEAANAGHVIAYGGDAFTARASVLFSEMCDEDVEVLFTFNGTGSNLVALGSLLQPAESVVCTQWSHINVDETGAPERILGVKLQDIASESAKLSVNDLHQLAHNIGNVHHVQPGVVSITQATELGTLYSIQEIKEIVKVSQSYGMRVHLDGARISNATAALGNSIETFRALTFDAGVDAVSFGGTKNAMLGAEAVLLRRSTCSPRAGFIRKSTTQLPSKMRYASAQFVEAIESGLWLETASHSNAMATRLYEKLKHVESLRLSPPQVNSMYPVLPLDVKKKLQEWNFFWDWDESIGQVRWMTSWDTSEEDVDRFAAGVLHFLAV